MIVPPDTVDVLVKVAFPAGRQIFGKLKLATGLGFIGNVPDAWLVHPLLVVTDQTILLFPDAVGV